MQISIVSPVTPVLPPFATGYAGEPLDTSRVTEPAGAAKELVALEDGGVALGLDPDDRLSLAPQWLAWMEWVDERQPLLAAAGAATA